MEFSIIKDILLVLSGAFATFFSTMFSAKLLRKKPEIIWRKTPTIRIAAHDLYSASWIIENTGKSSAKDTNIEIHVGNESTITYYDLTPSEKALAFNATINDVKNVLTVKIPLLPNGVSFDISCLISKPSEKDPAISIVGEDVIGKEHSPYSSDFLKQINRYSTYVQFGIAALGGIGMLFLIIFAALLMNSKYQYDQSITMANLFEKDNHYDTAIDVYENASANNWFYKDSPSLLFRIAELYAKNKEPEKSISTIKLAVEKSNKQSYGRVLQYLSTESSFDPMRNKKNFVEIIEKLKGYVNE